MEPEKVTALMEDVEELEECEDEDDEGYVTVRSVFDYDVSINFQFKIISKFHLSLTFTV